MIGELQPRHIHLPQLERSVQAGAPALRPLQHRGAKINAGYLRAWRVIGNVSPRPHASIKQPPRQTSKEQRTELTVTPMLEWKVKQVVERSDPPIFLNKWRAQVGHVHTTDTRPFGDRVRLL